MKLLTVEEVAKDHLSVSRSTVMRLIDSGSLPAVCLHRGKKKAIYRIRPEQLEKWILSREKATHKQTQPTTSGSTRGMPNNGLDTEALDLASSAAEKLP